MLNLIKLTENKIIFVDACVMIDYLWDKLENADEFELLLQNTKADVLFVPYYQVYEIFYDTEMKIKDKTANSSSAALASMLKNVPKHLRRSITYDNGSENVNHLQLNKQFKIARLSNKL